MKITKLTHFDIFGTTQVTNYKLQVIFFGERTEYQGINSWWAENVGQVYAPTRHIGTSENVLLKMIIYPQMKKMMAVSGGCTYLICDAGELKSYIIPSSSINIVA